jgi:hypothetical protein
MNSETGPLVPADLTFAAPNATYRNYRRPDVASSVLQPKKRGGSVQGAYFIELDELGGMPP